MTLDAIRQAIIDSISALTLGTFSVATGLPWDAAGEPLYTKNPKVIYVSAPVSVQSTLFSVLDNSPSLASRETTVLVYVQVDAKQTPANYNSLVTAIQSVKSTATISGVRSREVDVTTSLEADALLTEFEFRFTELIIT